MKQTEIWESMGILQQMEPSIASDLPRTMRIPQASSKLYLL